MPYGAVDLAALAAKPKSAPEGDDGKIRGTFVVDLTAETIQRVIETSQSLPVIISFRSERSANSVTLDEQLTAAAQQAGGRFQLARVDVDSFPDAAAAFRVTGVPAAVALLQGQPVPLFQGLPAEGELSPLIDRILEAAGQYGLTGILDGSTEEPPEPELPEHHRAALDALSAGDFATAQVEFGKALREDPSSTELMHGLAQAALLERIGKLEDPSATLQASIGVPLTDVEVHMAAADVEVAGGRPDAAFARLIDVVGPAEPLVAQARRALANALF